MSSWVLWTTLANYQTLGWGHGTPQFVPSSVRNIGDPEIATGMWSEEQFCGVKPLSYRELLVVSVRTGLNCWTPNGIQRIRELVAGVGRHLGHIYIFLHTYLYTFNMYLLYLLCKYTCIHLPYKYI